MLCIPEWRKAILSCAVLALPFVAGCGGGDDPGPINVPQCSGSACGPSGAETTPPVVTKLCPDALDYTTTYTGGSGSGEYVKVKFDTTSLTYQMQFIESSVPTSAGQVNDTRAGLTISGAFHHPTNLPTAEQNRCAFVLDSGATSDGAYSVTINRADPPMLFVGNGVVGGGIPGATIAFPGIELLPGLFLGTVPSRTFDFYPFIGFTDTETDFAKVAGNYNEVGIHLSPLGGNAQSTAGPVGWEPDVVNWNQTLNADGSCTITPNSDYSCQTTGSPWTLRKNADGSNDNVFVSNAVASQFGTPVYPLAGQGASLVIAPSQAKGIMIVGKLNGVRVPVVIRVGYNHVDAGNLLASVADPEVGISMLSSTTAIAANSLKGGYIGATSASACGVVTSTGDANALAVGGPSLDVSVPHPDLPGTFMNGAFYSAAGSCNDGTAVSTMAANYTSTLFQGATAAFIDPQTSSVTSQFALDYTQATPGKIKVTVAQDFNAKGANGNVAIFAKGDTGWLVTAGNVYAMVVNNSKVNPFFTVGAFVQ
ncbi:DUF2957 domain-containing protein [Burkholderia vietnamiensis]|uniref:DUF2957 domain-containing protein n=1 Tax=Burkholderia vietnamiensis TaxID=60552 RepID=UPI000753BDA8|nr:DUF2957 domain-containing protein [Burkholderia vietnamiensis]TPQ48237.1 DUF2957 domain-containing protein [Burkholderia ubonensis]AOJ16407.1 hypothetical protein WJ02_23000 [Burkholderia vietnamiensis]KVE32911.1 hypothetical protein WI93_25570 [Burkholderia vietnamiensis]KVE67606.1 hypothetical protein WI97_09480 [Burkholderia vietnamiensis]KVF18172.1 hypothetical protein WJ07_26490 [Burkholderia vietnamiensis]